MMLMFGDCWNRDVDSKRIKDDVYTYRIDELVKHYALARLQQNM